MQNLLYNDTPENIARCLNDNANKLLKEHLYFYIILFLFLLLLLFFKYKEMIKIMIII